MIADQNFYDICIKFFLSYGFGYGLQPTAYSLWLKLVRAKHSATSEGENCTYGPTLVFSRNKIPIHFFSFIGDKC